MTYYKSKYKPKNPEKYVNKKRLNDIVARSSWERAVMVWCDNNEDVQRWGSEEVIIPYKSKVDGRIHRYFIDFNIMFKNGRKILVEVKPKAQTTPPENANGKTKKRLITEVETYARNVSKWEYAKEFAKKHGAEFLIWTEDDLEKIGIPLVTSKRFKAIKFGKKKIKPAKYGTKKN